MGGTIKTLTKKSVAKGIVNRVAADSMPESPQEIIDEFVFRLGIRHLVEGGTGSREISARYIGIADGIIGEDPLTAGLTCQERVQPSPAWYYDTGYQIGLNFRKTYAERKNAF